ncbi:sporulation protein YhbH [Thermosyntropha sp.]|uniref:sporulation protein YhbH n=1 Tax=Thermosyntropha sp. TaxID=2740820 RepID=UPI0025EED0C8|nr:sporulation protein YhbH [Thermosyntropha sp.]MBO8158118.1 sporulation protein YhbH [Thermosyntropha sp.]
MAVFRDFEGEGRDRSAEDRRRHRELVEDSIKRNIGSIVAEESIIGQSKEKVFKIPIRGIKEYRFVYGENRPGVASGKGDEKRGQRIPGNRGGEIPQAGNGAGSIEGEDIYETEITLEELIEYMFEDLDLPYMEKKKFSYIQSEKSTKRWGIQRKGIPPRLNKKRSMMERIKRKKAAERTLRELGLDEEIERFPFSEEDLRYQRVKEDIRPESNAVVICIMDNSGSMYLSKKYMARSFFFLLYQFVRYRYANVDLVFINHTTTAKEVDEDSFFHRGESGGTIISSGYEKALEIINERYDKEIWNIYAFHCSDGDNWPEDIARAVEKAKELAEVCNLFGYGEIVSSWSPASTMLSEYKKVINAPNFVCVILSSKEDIWPAFKKILTVAEKE